MKLANVLHNKLVQVAASVTAIGVITSTVPGLWDNFGWMTPVAHASDITEMKDKQQAEYETILDAINKNFDAWQCDEWDEEMEGLLGSESPADLERLERLRKLRDRRSCERFDE